MFASTLIKGKVLLWVNTDLKNYLKGEADDVIDAWIEDFEKFT